MGSDKAPSSSASSSQPPSRPLKPIKTGGSKRSSQVFPLSNSNPNLVERTSPKSARGASAGGASFTPSPTQGPRNRARPVTKKKAGSLPKLRSVGLVLVVAVVLLGLGLSFLYTRTYSNTPAKILHNGMGKEAADATSKEKGEASDVAVGEGGSVAARSALEDQGEHGDGLSSSSAAGEGGAMLGQGGKGKGEVTCDECREEVSTLLVAYKEYQSRMASRFSGGRRRLLTFPPDPQGTPALQHLNTIRQKLPDLSMAYSGNGTNALDIPGTQLQKSVLLEDDDVDGGVDVHMASGGAISSDEVDVEQPPSGPRRKLLQKMDSQILRIKLARTVGEIEDLRGKVEEMKAQYEETMKEILRVKNLILSQGEWSPKILTRNANERSREMVAEECDLSQDPDFKPARRKRQAFTPRPPAWKGYSCQASPADLNRYKRYTPKELCPDDWLFVQDLIFNDDCFALPVRQCFSRTPQDMVQPLPRPQSFFSQRALKDDMLRWSLHKCKSFECLNARAEGDCRNCFNFTLEEHRWKQTFRGTHTIPEVLAMKPGSIRLGLDVGGGTGSFAAQMALHNVSILTTAMNLETVVSGVSGGLPYMEAIAARGCVPLWVPHKARLPFFDNTLDIIHSVNSVKYLSPMDFQELLFDWDRVLRPGGIIWLEMFYAPIEELPLYATMMYLLGYKKLDWRMSLKPEGGERQGLHLYINAILEKPARKDPPLPPGAEGNQNLALALQASLSSRENEAEASGSDRENPLGMLAGRVKGKLSKGKGKGKGKGEGEDEGDESVPPPKAEGLGVRLVKGLAGKLLEKMQLMGKGKKVKAGKGKGMEESNGEEVGVEESSGKGETEAGSGEGEEEDKGSKRKKRKGGLRRGADEEGEEGGNHGNKAAAEEGAVEEVAEEGKVKRGGMKKRGAKRGGGKGKGGGETEEGTEGEDGDKERENQEGLSSRGGRRTKAAKRGRGKRVNSEGEGEGERGGEQGSEKIIHRKHREDEGEGEGGVGSGDGEDEGDGQRHAMENGKKQKGGGKRKGRKVAEEEGEEGEGGGVVETGSDGQEKGEDRDTIPNKKHKGRGKFSLRKSHGHQSEDAVDEGSGAKGGDAGDGVPEEGSAPRGKGRSKGGKKRGRQGLADEGSEKQGGANEDEGSGTDENTGEEVKKKLSAKGKRGRMSGMGGEEAGARKVLKKRGKPRLRSEAADVEGEGESSQDTDSKPRKKRWRRVVE